METALLNLGLSYTMSKLLPYILMAIIGIVMGILLFKKFKSKWLKVLAIVLIFVPFILYFVFNPIYQGDFSNDQRVSKIDSSTAELKGKKFVLIAMAGCPYCFDAISSLKAIQKRNPEVKIEYIVATADSTALSVYEKEINGAFPIRMATNMQAMAEVAQGRFPAYVVVTSDDKLLVWNNTFGVKALDVVIDNFN